jgi:hypothetical protein
LKFYADVHRSKRNGEGCRITYTTDGITFKHVDSFSEIPARPGDKLFMDTLPPQHTDGAIELLRRRVGVYYLRRLTLIEKVRREHRLPKSSRGDIRVLMSIEERWFRRVTEDFLVMRRMILAYRSLMKTYIRLVNKAKALSGRERITLKPATSSIEKQMVEMASMIAGEAGRRYLAYNRLVEVLGVGGRSSALESLVEVFTYAEWSSWCRVRNYFGLWDRDGKTHYHKTKARNALETLTLSIKGYRTNSRDIEEVLKTRKAGIIAQA